MQYSKPYTITIPSAIYLDKITAHSKLLYGVIASLCNQKGYCYASNAYLADAIQMKERSIRKYLLELKTAGHIVVDIESAGKRHIHLVTKVGTNMPEVGINVPGGRHKRAYIIDKEIKEEIKKEETSSDFIKSSSLSPKKANKEKKTTKSEANPTNVTTETKVDVGGSPNNDISMNPLDSISSPSKPAGNGMTATHLPDPPRNRNGEVLEAFTDDGESIKFKIFDPTEIFREDSANMQAAKMPKSLTKLEKEIWKYRRIEGHDMTGFDYRRERIAAKRLKHLLGEEKLVNYLYKLSQFRQTRQWWKENIPICFSKLTDRVRELLDKESE